MHKGRLLVAALAAAAAVACLGATTARADYGPLAEYQVTLSMNCNNPSFCGADNLGGFWGWAVFNTDGTADAQLTGCGHLQGGGGGGASHFSADASWFIQGGTFWTFNETDTFVGHGTPTTSFTPDPQDSGIPAAPGHYNATDLFGFKPPPGVVFNIQVTKIPNR